MNYYKTENSEAILSSDGVAVVYYALESGKAHQNYLGAEPWIEIEEEEFAKLMKQWAGVANKAFKEQKLKESVFTPKTKYTVIFGDIELEGYSEKSRLELCYFVQDARELVILDENGQPSALLKEDIIDEASFTFSEIE